MPTPFYHLTLADDLLKSPNLPFEVRRFLRSSRAAFLFGATAPDVQVVSDQPRPETHFFNLPIQEGDPPAWELFLVKNPHLAAAQMLDPARTAFLAGYLCHLQADWMWVKGIFAPVFGPYCTWGTFRRRLYLHNVLRAYLDASTLPTLPPDTGECLRSVQPYGWLPFVDSRHLAEWRDFLVRQLLPGGAIQTGEVLSARQGIPVQEFEALVSSEERMQREIFDHLPFKRVEECRQQIFTENSRLTTRYLDYLLHDMISAEDIIDPGAAP